MANTPVLPQTTRLGWSHSWVKRFEIPSHVSIEPISHLPGSPHIYDTAPFPIVLAVIFTVPCKKVRSCYNQIMNNNVTFLRLVNRLRA